MGQRTEFPSIKLLNHEVGHLDDDYLSHRFNKMQMQKMQTYFERLGNLLLVAVTLLVIAVCASAHQLQTATTFVIIASVAWLVCGLFGMMTRPTHPSLKPIRLFIAVAPTMATFALVMLTK